MKVQYTLPKDEKFFGDYATLTPTLVKLGYLAQIVNALTELGVIYSIVEGSLQDFFPNYSSIAGLFGAIVGTLFLEVGLRKFIPFSVRAILYKRFAGLHLYITGFIFFITLLLLASGIFLSFHGSKELVMVAAPKPKLESLDKADSITASKKAEAFSRYSADSLGVVTRLKPMFSALKSKYSAQLQQQRQQLARFSKKYPSKIDLIKSKISEIQALEANDIASLEKNKAKDLEVALEARNKALEALEATYSRQRLRVEQKNFKAEASTETKVKNYSGGLSWFTVICHLVLLFSITITEIHKKGSSIEEVPLPNQYYFSQSIVSEFLVMISDKINYYLRSFIRKQANRTPEPPEPEEPPTLWEIAQQGIKRKNIILAGKPEEPNIHPFSQNGLHQYDSLFDGSASTSATIESRRPIGFNSTITHSINKETEEKASSELLDSSKKPCLQCATMFRPKTTWQKFCNPQCREAFHELKHGKKFNPNQFHKIKNRKV